MAKSSQYANKKIYTKVRELDNNRCVNCGSFNGVQTHHIILRSQGGLTTEDNLICLCVTCHNKVHSAKIKMINILKKFEKAPFFRWKEPLEYLEKRENYEN